MAADGRADAPVFTLPELRRACVRAFLRGQRAHLPWECPEYPLPEHIDRIVSEILEERV